MLKIGQVAERLNCSLANAYALIESGKLPAVNVGAGGGGVRVTEEDLDSFIQSRRTAPTPAPQNVKQVTLKHLR